jgi:hypothetical protein
VVYDYGYFDHFHHFHHFDEGGPPLDGVPMPAAVIVVHDEPNTRELVVLSLRAAFLKVRILGAANTQHAEQGATLMSHRHHCREDRTNCPVSEGA